MNTAHHLDLLGRFDRGLALKEAIFATVREGDTVVDAGCGTGILSIWAAQAGAGRVLAVDSADVGLGKRLAKENGVAARIEFLQADLSDFGMPDGERCDVLLGMVYFNDPRRDEAQAALTGRLREELLRPGGRQIPDRVVYTAGVMEWPEQDINARFSDIDRKIDVMERRYDLTFAAVREASKRVPDGAWFPVRGNSGALDRGNARMLSSGKDLFCEVDYAGGFHGYGKRFACRITQPGTCHVLLFTQELYAGERLIFSNESISWIANPRPVEPGAEVRFTLDEGWSGTNILTMEKA